MTELQVRIEFMHIFSRDKHQNLIRPRLSESQITTLYYFTNKLKAYYPVTSCYNNFKGTINMMVTILKVTFKTTQCKYCFVTILPILVCKKRKKIQTLVIATYLKFNECLSFPWHHKDKAAICRPQNMFKKPHQNIRPTKTWLQKIPLQTQQIMT